VFSALDHKIDIPAEFRTNPNQTHLIKIFRIRKLKAGQFNQG